jgi:hypothetical protein
MVRSFAVSHLGLSQFSISMPKINKDVKRLQSNGYPFRSMLDLMQSDPQTNTIVYTSPQFQPCAETFPDNWMFFSLTAA